MTAFILCMVLSLLLFLTSRFMTQYLFTIILITFQSKKVAVALLSLLLYPGVVIHEFSHLVAAVVLFVRVHDMSLLPKVVDNMIRGGSVTIEKVDIFRRTLVGIAPFFGGLAALWLVMTFLIPTRVVLPIMRLLAVDTGSLVDSFLLSSDYRLLYMLVGFYLLFSISATMYSSRKDLEAVIYTVPFLIILVIIAYVMGFQAEWLFILLRRMDQIFLSLASVLFLALAFQGMMSLFLLLLRSRIHSNSNRFL